MLILTNIKCLEVNMTYHIIFDPFKYKKRVFRAITIADKISKVEEYMRLSFLLDNDQEILCDYFQVVVFVMLLLKKCQRHRIVCKNIYANNEIEITHISIMLYTPRCT